MKLNGKLLRSQRECMGLSITEMAKRAGVSRPSIYAYENMADDNVSNKILEAYLLEVYPLVGSMPADINEILQRVEKYIQDTFATKCKVKLTIELCGDKE